MCFGSLSSAPLKNENAHDSLSGITIATFFFRKVKHGLPHLSSSVRPQSSAVWRSFSVSFCHFFAYGTFIVQALFQDRRIHSILPLPLSSHRTPVPRYSCKGCPLRFHELLRLISSAVLDSAGDRRSGPSSVSVRGKS